MTTTTTKNYTLVAVLLAVLATFIWSGNFVVARKIYKDIPPVSLSFYRWSLATLVLLPFAWKKFVAEWTIVKRHLPYFLALGLFGVSLFNTLVYIGGHYTPAINLALIGTTSSPVISNILAKIFLKEKLGIQKIVGMALCIAGVLYLLTQGNLGNLASLKFSEGDLWALLAACSFSIYNTLVRKEPAGVTPVNFLFTCFMIGTLSLVPFFLWEMLHSSPVNWSGEMVLVIVYLGVGASVASFLLWNIAIHRLGAGRAALFGNLIPVFSSLEAVIILKEAFTNEHIVSMTLVFLGLLVANFSLLVNRQRTE